MKKLKSLNKKCYSRQKRWYNQRFEWRLEFKCPRGLTSAPGINWQTWKHLISLIEELKIDFRYRSERTRCLFVNDLKALDVVLDDQHFLSNLVRVEYSDDMYLSELSKLGISIVNDVKFVKNIPTLKFKIVLGNFNRNDSSIREELGSYIIKNSDVFHVSGVDFDLLNRRRSKVWTNFSCLTNTIDDIVILHMIAPGKIKKVFELLHKNKEETS